MIRTLVIAALLFAAPAWAQQSVPLTGAGGAFKAASTSSYMGPADVVSSPTAFWSCSRAMSAAYAAGAGNACDIADVGTGLITCTMKFATNGFADLSSNLCSGGTLTVPAFCTANTSCIVTKMYEQTGVTNCNSSGAVPCDVVKQSLLAALTFNCIGTIPCVTFPGSSNQYLQSAILTPSISQPCTYIGVAQRSSAATQNAIISDGASADGVYYSGSGAGIFMYAGTITTTISGANGSPHAFQASFGAGGTSLLNVDSSGATTVTPGAGACATAGDALDITGPSASFLNGIVWEIGLWPIAFNGTQIANMNSNQHTEYGF